MLLCPCAFQGNPDEYYPGSTGRKVRHRVLDERSAERCECTFGRVPSFYTGFTGDRGMMKSVLTACLLLCGVVGYTNSQADVPAADEVLDKVSGLVPELNNLNTSAIPSVDEVKNLFKQKCDKNGGPDAYERANLAQEEMQQCLTSLINVTELQADMETYKPTGDLDIVFKKYCRKSPILKKCVTNFTAAIEPCLEEKERENKRIVQNITDSLLGFICFKEGDRIALFISAGGPECLQEKQQQIQDCLNTTLGRHIPVSSPNSIPGLDSLPSLVFGRKQCTDFMNLQTCVVGELEKCNDPTPANIVDSILTFVLRTTPCNEYFGETVKSVNAGTRIDVLSMTSIALLLMLRLL